MPRRRDEDESDRWALGGGSVPLLDETAGMLPKGIDLTEFREMLDDGRPDLAWEALRPCVGQHPMSSQFWAHMSKAANLLRNR